MLANDFALELSRGTQPPADDSPIFSWEPPLEQADACTLTLTLTLALTVTLTQT